MNIDWLFLQLITAFNLIECNESRKEEFKFPERGNYQKSSIYHMILRILHRKDENIVFSMSGSDFEQYFYDCYFFIDENESLLRQGYILNYTNHNMNIGEYYRDIEYSYDEDEFKNMNVYVSFYFNTAPLRASFGDLQTRVAQEISESDDMEIYDFQKIKLLIDNLILDNDKMETIFNSFQKLASQELGEYFGLIPNNDLELGEQIEQMFYDPVEYYEMNFSRDGNLFGYMENSSQNLRYITKYLYMPLLVDIYPYTNELLNKF